MHAKYWVGALIAASVVLLNTAPALAQDGGVSPDSVVIDNLWVLIAGVLVFIMQAGFGMVEAGMTRAKNVGNIMAKNLADVCVGALAFFAVGYGIAYGTDAGSLLGVDTFLLSGAELGFSAEGGLSIFTDFFFQVVFAATAVTIASGAMAERTKMSAETVAHRPDRIRGRESVSLDKGVRLLLDADTQRGDDVPSGVPLDRMDQSTAAARRIKPPPRTPVSPRARRRGKELLPERLALAVAEVTPRVLAAASGDAGGDDRRHRRRLVHAVAHLETDASRDPIPS